MPLCHFIVAILEMSVQQGGKRCLSLNCDALHLALLTCEEALEYVTLPAQGARKKILCGAQSLHASITSAKGLRRFQEGLRRLQQS